MINCSFLDFKKSFPIIRIDDSSEIGISIDNSVTAEDLRWLTTPDPQSVESPALTLKKRLISLTIRIEAELHPSIQSTDWPVYFSAMMINYPISLSSFNRLPLLLDSQTLILCSAGLHSTINSSSWSSESPAIMLEQSFPVANFSQLPVLIKKLVLFTLAPGVKRAHWKSRVDLLEVRDLKALQHSAELPDSIQTLALKIYNLQGQQCIRLLRLQQAGRVSHATILSEPRVLQPINIQTINNLSSIVLVVLHSNITDIPRRDISYHLSADDMNPTEIVATLSHFNQKFPLARYYDVILPEKLLKINRIFQAPDASCIKKYCLRFTQKMLIPQVENLNWNLCLNIEDLIRNDLNHCRQLAAVPERIELWGTHPNKLELIPHLPFCKTGMIEFFSPDSIQHASYFAKLPSHFVQVGFFYPPRKEHWQAIPAWINAISFLRIRWSKKEVQALASAPNIRTVMVEWESNEANLNYLPDTISTLYWQEPTKISTITKLLKKPTITTLIVACPISLAELQQLLHNTPPKTLFFFASCFDQANVQACMAGLPHEYLLVPKEFCNPRLCGRENIPALFAMLRLTQGKISVAKRLAWEAILQHQQCNRYPQQIILNPFIILARITVTQQQQQQPIDFRTIWQNERWHSAAPYLYPLAVEAEQRRQRILWPGHNTSLAYNMPNLLRLEAEYQTLLEKLKVQDALLHTCAGSLEQKNEVIDELQEKLAAAEKKAAIANNIMQASLANGRNQTAILEQAKTAAEQTIGELRTQLSQEQKFHERTNSFLKTQEAEVRAAQQIVEKLRQELKTTHEKANNLARELESAQQERAALQQQKQAIEAQLAAQRAASQQQQSDLQQQSQQQAANFQQQMKNQEASLQHSLRGVEVLLANQQDELTKLQQQLTEATALNEANKIEMSTLRGEQTKLQAQQGVSQSQQLQAQKLLFKQSLVELHKKKIDLLAELEKPQFAAHAVNPLRCKEWELTKLTTSIVKLTSKLEDLGGKYTCPIHYDTMAMPVLLTCCSNTNCDESSAQTLKEKKLPCPACRKTVDSYVPNGTLKGEISAQKEKLGRLKQQAETLEAEIVSLQRYYATPLRAPAFLPDASAPANAASSSPPVILPPAVVAALSPNTAFSLLPSPFNVAAPQPSRAAPPSPTLYRIDRSLSSSAPPELKQSQRRDA